MKRLRRFLTSHADRRLLFQSFCFLAGVRLGLWIAPAKLVSQSLSYNQSAADSGKNDWSAIRQVVSAVKFWSRFVPKATCLTQALATQRILRRRGQHCVVKIGVNRAVDDLAAHAWIEIEGRIVIGRVSGISRYSVMSGMKERAA
jgi:hypothetical protein